MSPKGGCRDDGPVRFPPGTPEYAVVVPRSSSMSDLVGPLWSRVWFFGASGGSCPDLGGEPSEGSLVRVLARPALVVRTAVESGSVVRVRTSLSAGAAKLPSPACFDDAVMRVRLSPKGSSPWFCCPSYLIRVRSRRIHRFFCRSTVSRARFCCDVLAVRCCSAHRVVGFPALDLPGYPDALI